MQSCYRRWESRDRWYEASIGPDLFGQLMLTCRWGSLRSARGGMQCRPLTGAAEAGRLLQALSRRRERHGYRVVADLA